MCNTEYYSFVTNTVQIIPYLGLYIIIYNYDNMQIILIRLIAVLIITTYLNICNIKYTRLINRFRSESFFVYDDVISLNGKI